MNGKNKEARLLRFVSLALSHPDHAFLIVSAFSSLVNGVKYRNPASQAHELLKRLESVTKFMGYIRGEILTQKQLGNNKNEPSKFRDMNSTFAKMNVGS